MSVDISYLLAYTFLLFLTAVGLLHYTIVEVYKQLYFEASWCILKLLFFSRDERKVYFLLFSE